MENKTESDVEDAKRTIYFSVMVTVLFSAITILSSI
jgi:hypothetical protein